MLYPFTYIIQREGIVSSIHSYKAFGDAWFWWI